MPDNFNISDQPDGGGGGFTERVSVFNSVDQSIPDATITLLDFDSERIDTDSMHDNAVNNSRITFTTAGVYCFGYNILWEAASGGDVRASRVRLNGGAVIVLGDGARDTGTSGIPPGNGMSGIRTFSSADFIDIIVEQDEGGALDVLAGTNLIQFWAYRIG